MAMRYLIKNRLDAKRQGGAIDGRLSGAYYFLK